MTSRPTPSIKVDDMEVRSMSFRLLLRGAANITTAIVRMLGKAVKLRHCPATVSAPAAWPVVSARAGNQPGPSVCRGGPSLTTAGEPQRARRWEGGWKWRKSGDRSSAPYPLAVRGERRSHHACFRTIARSLESRATPYIRSSSTFSRRRFLPGCVHPRHRHGCLRRQGHRRQCGFGQQRQSGHFDSFYR